MFLLMPPLICTGASENHIKVCQVRIHNGHFPGEPGLASVYWSKVMEVEVTTGAIRCAKLQSNHHHQQTNNQFFTGRMPFLSPNQQCQSTEGKNITFHGLAYPKFTGGLPTLSLTTSSCWLRSGRFAMPLISPLMPVPQLFQPAYIK